MQKLLLGFGVLVMACRSSQPAPDERSAIAQEIEREVKAAYDLKNPDMVKNELALYADTGRIVSVTGANVTASRDTIFQGIRDAWTYVLSNMKNPTWMWGDFYIDVLSRDAAVMTTSYHVPHTTPQGHPHIIGGTWTAAFRKQGDRWVIVQEHLSDIPPAVADSLHAHMNHGPPD